MLDLTHVIAPAVISLVGSGGAFGLVTARLNRRDQLQDREEVQRKEKREAQEMRVQELHAQLLNLKAQMDAMGVECPYPEWTKDPYSNEIVECNAACRRVFFLPARIAEPVGKTFADANFLPEALAEIERANRDAMQFGAAIAICRPTPGSDKMAFVKRVGETRGMKRQVIMGFAMPANVLFAGEIGPLADAIQVKQAERIAAARHAHNTPQIEAA